MLIWDLCGGSGAWSAPWGSFRPPPMGRVAAVEGSKMHRLPPSPDRKAQRSITPAGFARAFFEANP